MKVAVDERRCEGYGFCEERAPELLQLDDEGQLLILRPDVADGEADKARAAVRSCPVAALRLED
ncbi:ferredoxin [Nocardioides sp. NPDC023903]|uniref:ferredoxin n=1 Tax=Nocardioides sp. NPDC023903 TaxID=3157195 RepID=UPI0033DDC2CB